MMPPLTDFACLPERLFALRLLTLRVDRFAFLVVTFVTSPLSSLTASPRPHSLRRRPETRGWLHGLSARLARAFQLRLGRSSPVSPIVSSTGGPSSFSRLAYLSTSVALLFGLLGHAD